MGRRLHCHARVFERCAELDGIQLHAQRSAQWCKQRGSRKDGTTEVWHYAHTHKAATPSATLSGELRLTDSNRVILDGSARRFQAHRIYLRIAAAKRWAHHRTNVLRGQRPTAQHLAQLTAVNNTFRRVSLSPSLSRTHSGSLIWNRGLQWTRTNSRDLHYNRNWHK